MRLAADAAPRDYREWRGGVTSGALSIPPVPGQLRTHPPPLPCLMWGSRLILCRPRAAPSPPHPSPTPPHRCHPQRHPPVSPPPHRGFFWSPRVPFQPPPPSRQGGGAALRLCVAVPTLALGSPPPPCGDIPPIGVPAAGEGGGDKAWWLLCHPARLLPAGDPLRVPPLPLGTPLGTAGSGGPHRTAAPVTLAREPR